MVRVVAPAVCGASVAIASLAGCSGTNKAEAKSPAATTGGVSTSTGAGSATVTIDGQQQNIREQVVCATTGNGFNIGIGEQGTATKDGKHYTISGTATGVNKADPMQPVTEPREIKVSCPQGVALRSGLWPAVQA